MRFTKMHGLGNDYLYVYGQVPDDIAELSIKLSDRHFGAGSDGMIYICPSEKADFQMRIFNADGSEALMCGNGIRCVGKYVYDRGYTDKTYLEIDTLSGVKYLDLNVEKGKVKTVAVNMGKAEARTDVGLSFSLPENLTADFSENLLFRNLALTMPSTEEPLAYGQDSLNRLTVKPVSLQAEQIICTPVSVGNPHAVIFVKDMEKAPLYELGPIIEHHPHFPGGVNVEFVQKVAENELRMRVWERGSAVTTACGTGACASVMAAVKKGLCEYETPVTVHLDGGDLIIKILPDDTVIMTGPAEFVYDAETID